MHGCPALPASYLHLNLLGLHSAQAQCHHACASWRHACRLLCPSSKLRQQKIRHKEGELGHSKRQANGQLPDDLHVDVPSRREGGLIILPCSGNTEKSSGPSGPPSPPHSGPVTKGARLLRARPSCIGTLEEPAAPAARPGCAFLFTGSGRALRAGPGAVRVSTA